MAVLYGVRLACNNGARADFLLAVLCVLHTAACTSAIEINGESTPHGQCSGHWLHSFVKGW